VLAAGFLLISMTADTCAGSFSGLYFTNSSLSPGYYNMPYESFVIVTGGVTPYSYVVYSGALPPGLYINPYTGRVYGVPTAVGTYAFVCRVYDGRFPPYYIQRTFLITVTPI
jgi:hypothetical protein